MLERWVDSGGWWWGLRRWRWVGRGGRHKEGIEGWWWGQKKQSKTTPQIA
jgi:hypothetical protein